VSASPEFASSLSDPVLFRFLLSSPSDSGRPFRFPESFAGLEGAGKLNSSSFPPLLFFPLPFCLLDLKFFLGSISQGVAAADLPRFALPFAPGSGESVNLQNM
jgi:hypothetical protein